METLPLVLLVIIITALVVWNLPRLRAEAAARRLRPPIGATAPRPAAPRSFPPSHPRPTSTTERLHAVGVRAAPQRVDQA